MQLVFELHWPASEIEIVDWREYHSSTDSDVKLTQLSQAINTIDRWRHNSKISNTNDMHKGITSSLLTQ